jgi:hypothetical protein
VPAESPPVTSFVTAVWVLLLHVHGNEWHAAVFLVCILVVASQQ